MALRILIGELRHRVNIQNLTGATDAGTRGQSQKAFANDGNPVQASIKTIAGNETVLGQQVDARATHVIGMYYTDRITSRSRLKKGSRYFNVLSFENVDEIDRFLILQCEETR